MDTTLTLLIVALGLALLLYPIAHWLHLPFSLLLLIGGIIAGQVISGLGWDIGLRWFHVHDIVVTLLLPLLVFESALHIRWSRLKKVLLSVVVLAIPMTVIATLLTAAVLYFGINHPQGFPWVAALLAAAIISATDPVAVVDMLKKVRAPERLTTLLEGESLLNDAVAIVLFNTFLLAAVAGHMMIDWSTASIDFVRLFIGGIALGLLVAWIMRGLTKIVSDNTLFTVLTLVAAYGTFLLAEHWLHVSGIAALLIIGISLAERDITQAKQVWAYQAFIANVLVFLLMGITIEWLMFSERYLAIIIALIAALAVRSLSVFGVLPLVSHLPGGIRFDTNEKAIVAWGGLRGAVAAALALSLPLTLDYWFTIQSIAYGVIIFTLLVQAPTMPYLLRRLQRK